jgi:hypothetical protein
MHSTAAPVRPKKRLIKRFWFWAVCSGAAYLLVTRAPIPFVQSGWQTGEEDWNDGWKRRHRMADWLVLTHSLVGLSRAEVVAKLGEPPPTEYFKSWSMVYILGAERGFMSIDSEWLVLRLDSASRVSEVSIVRD